MNSLAILLSALLSALLTLLITPLVIRRHYSMGIVGRDVHKPNPPIVPEMGGVAIVTSVTISSLLLAFMAPEARLHLLILLVAFLLAAVIGAYDDLKGLRPKVKVLLTVVCCTPIILAGLLSPHAVPIGRPTLPLVGSLRLTIIYWALLPFAVAVPANAVNMMDVYNGVMPATCLLASIALLASGLILERWVAVYLTSPLIGSLAVYYFYNKYPARVFSGDIGSLSVGAALGAIAVLAGLEVVGMVALMPHIMNAFHSLVSVKGLFERRQLSTRPTIVREGWLEANPSPKAPLTLANLLLSSGPSTEEELVNCFVFLSALSALLAVLTAILMLVSI